MSALSDLVHIKDRNRNALQNAVIAYDHRPQEAAEILAAMQARIEKLETENSVMYAALLEASELGNSAALRCKVELQRIARNEAKE